MLLDIGCRNRKQENFIGIDWISRPGVDIAHNLEKFPYPIKSDSCITIKCAHVIEHIKPWLVVDFMNEMWRMLIVNGQLAISAPYAGSKGYLQDPTHCTQITEQTWMYFDQVMPLYNHYKPKPWRVEHISFRVDGNVETIMKKVPEPEKEMSLVQSAMMLGAIQKSSELHDMIQFLKDKPLKTIVEVGTARGGVLYALCQLAPSNATIVSIDLPNGHFGVGLVVTDDATFKTFAKGKQQLHFLRKDSHKPSTKKSLQKILNGKKLDLLFIDGDHTYEGVKKDWTMYSPFMKEGGFVVFHDISFHPKVPECQVEKFWKELSPKYKHIEFVDNDDPTWAGIGVITFENHKKTKQ